MFFTAQIIWIPKHYVNINHRKMLKSIHISLLKKVDVCSSSICMEFDCYHNHRSSNSNDWFVSAVKKKNVTPYGILPKQWKEKLQKISAACTRKHLLNQFSQFGYASIVHQKFVCGKKCFSCRKLQNHIGPTLNKYSARTISLS